MRFNKRPETENPVKDVPGQRVTRSQQIERLAMGLMYDNYYGADDVWDSIGDMVRNDCRKRATVMLDYMDTLEVE